MTSAVVGGAASLTLRYDGRGRLQRTSGGGVATNYYVYDGDQLIAEYTSNGKRHFCGLRGGAGFHWTSLPRRALMTPRPACPGSSR
ncbi:MAG: hypothetical protein LC634_02880 [Sphingomonadales bacterium]|nr:hypothetical protein [Sphingomonadales bacterium]